MISVWQRVVILLYMLFAFSGLLATSAHADGCLQENMDDTSTGEWAIEIENTCNYNINCQFEVIFAPGASPGGAASLRFRANFQSGRVNTNHTGSGEVGTYRVYDCHRS